MIPISNKMHPENSNSPSVIRVGIMTEKKGPHLGIYLKALAECEGVAKAAICDESGAEFGHAEKALKPKYGDVPTYLSPARMFAEFNPGFIIVTNRSSESGRAENVE